MQMNKNSLFAILLRSPWWVSFLVAGGLFALARFVLPTLYAAFVPLPFVGIGCYAAWRQLRAPSASTVAAALESMRALSWEEFAAALEAAFQRDSYNVKRLAIAAADLELTKAGRVTLVACKRWKVARAGIEPLRELEALRQARDAHECLFVAAGEVTENANAFAAEKKIRLLHGVELAQLLPKTN
jgi:restriction system protein